MSTTMPWPTPTDYRHAIQNPRTALDDEQLRQGEVSRDARGLPILWSGNFASVYRIECPGTGKTWALKCFTRDLSARQERYRHIAAGLEAASLPFTVPFVYLERGIQVHGQWYPAVKMEWVEGQTLNRFVEESLEKPKMLRQLLDLWPKLVVLLRDAEIAHADLQHGNVLLVPTPDGKLALKLIDYDGMYVSSLAGTRSGEAGHPNYQHPRRLLEGVYNVHVDRFSHLVIYAAVYCLLVGKRDVWNRFNNDENLLFCERDFQAPERSALLRTLWEMKDPGIRGLVGRLALACRQSLEETPWLDELVFKGRVQALSRSEERLAAEVLTAASAAVGTLPPVTALPGTAAPQPWEAPPATPLTPALPADTRPVTTEGALPAPVALPSPPGDRRPFALRSAIVSSVRAADGLLLRMVGPDNTILHNFLRAFVAIALVLLVGFAATMALPRIGSLLASREDDSLSQQEPVAETRVPEKELTVDLGGGVKMELILIPAGSFMMGNEKGDGAGKPVHEVNITKPVYLGKYEVTQEQWQAVMGSNPSRFKAPKNPVENVSWDDCQQFFAKLNVKSLPGGGKFQLPTEAQWEFACRAGSTTSYCYGDNESVLGDYAWFAANSGNRTHPFGGKKPNAWGLYDMHGNVWEWCADWYDGSYYGKSPTDDPPGPTKGSDRVFRGGSWDSPAVYCRSARRYKRTPGLRGHDMGFRVALVPADTAGGTGVTSPSVPLKLRPVEAKTVEAGKPLKVKVSLEGTDSPAGKVRYSLGAQPPPGAKIDPQSGDFIWTPPADQTAGKYNVMVSAQGPDGQTAETSFVVTVTRPTPSQEKELTVDLGGGVKLELVLIPAGEFIMGSPNSDNDAMSNEKPQHRVRITKPFYLGKYEVTQEQWQAVMGNNPSHFKGLKNPVVQVSWEDCQEFLNTLNTMSERERGTFRFPTEAQWEYACRAGSTTRYCFGDKESGLGEYAWYDANSGKKTHPVGGKKPNAWGLYDMHGNVLELCADWYGSEYDAGSPTDDPLGPSGGSTRVIRGGDWFLLGWICRSAVRGVRPPGDRDNSVGLRVSLVPADTAAGTGVTPPSAPLKLRPIEAKTVEVGKPLNVTVSLEDAEAWKGKVRYSLGPQCPPGAKIDPQSGEFSWTPPPDHAAGKVDVTVSAQGPDGRTAQTSFVVTVTRPTPSEPGKKPLTVDLGGGVKMELVLIPAGSFMMGSEKGDGAEKPVHKVTITKPFYLGKCEVTQEQWQAIMRENPSHFKGPKNPVESVGWNDCQEFFAKLNAKPGPGGGKFQLPTEAQWEYACRAGSKTRYCFGENKGQLGEYAWYDNNSGDKTHPVGGKKSNAWGLHDLHGNVWEWCQDWHDGSYYGKSPTDDPAGPTGGSSRVNRGGSWKGTAMGCPSANRAEGTPGHRSDALGFRVSLVPAEAVTDKRLPESAAPRKSIGHLISDSTVLLLYQEPPSSAWQRVGPAQPLSSGCTLLAPPTYRPAIALADGATLQLLGGTRVEIRPFDPPEPPTVSVAYGRIVLQAVADKRARLGLRAGRLAGVLELEPGSIAAIEVGRSPSPGADPESRPGALRLALYAVRGQASWRSEKGGSETRLSAPSQWLLEENSPQASPTSAANVPAWVQSETLSPLDARASISIAQALQPNQPAGSQLTELTEHRIREVQWLAIRSLAFTGNVEPMIVKLSDPESRVHWSDCFDRLREAVSRDPADAASVRVALEKQHGPTGRDLYRMLWGYTDEDLQRGEDAKLVGFLDHESLAVRVLASLSLKSITGLGLLYRPELPLAMRQASVSRWRELQKAGKIRLTKP